MARRLIMAAFAVVVVLSVLATGAHRTLADERDFSLTNGTASEVITHVYVSVSTVDSWEEDILGQDVLNSGDSVTIHFSPKDSDAGSCSYDIRVDGADGGQGFLYNVDLCSTNTVTFSN